MPIAVGDGNGDSDVLVDEFRFFAHLDVGPSSTSALMDVEEVFSDECQLVMICEHEGAFGIGNQGEVFA